MSVRKFEKQYIKQQKQNAGKVAIFDCGFQKIDKNPKCKGTCQEQNTKKFIELCCKLPKQKLNLSMRIYLIYQEPLKRYISHTHIYDRKNNRLIDVSNGQTKMFDYDLWFDTNDIRKYKEITWNDMDKKFKEGLRCEGIDTYEETIEHLLRNELNRHNRQMRK
jgi:hypothetical protein